MHPPILGDGTPQTPIFERCRTLYCHQGVIELVTLGSPRSPHTTAATLATDMMNMNMGANVGVLPPATTTSPVRGTRTVTFGVPPTALNAASSSATGLSSASGADSGSASNSTGTGSSSDASASSAIMTGSSSLAVSKSVGTKKKRKTTRNVRSFMRKLRLADGGRSKRGQARDADTPVDVLS